MLQTDKFQNDVARHTRLFELISSSRKPMDEGVRNSVLLGEYEDLSKSIALVFSNFSCGCCQSKDKLQYHHLIGRPMKKFMSFNWYYTRRHLMVNVMILCHDCHANLHGGRVGTTPSIPESKIEEIRKKYFGAIIKTGDAI
jgi:hypothetical protein